MLIKDNALNLDFKLEETKVYQTMPEYNYWRGWWNEPPRNTVEIVIMHLWQPLIDINDYKNGGFEYWSRRTEVGRGHLEWHQDTGEYHNIDNNYWISDKSLIYYPKVSDDCVGGFLELATYNTRGTLEESQTAARNIDYNEVQRIKAVTDRFVLMDAAQMHRISRVYKGYRLNLATSIWKTTPKIFTEYENYNGQFTFEKVDWKYKNALD